MNRMINLELDIEDVIQLVGNLEDAGKSALQGSWYGIEYLSDLVYTRAWSGCPVASGTLRASAYKEVEVTHNEAIAHVGFGGKYNRLNVYTGKMSDSYAIDVHEGWKISAASRQYGATRKWLAKALNSVNPIFEKIMAIHIRAALAGADDEALHAAISSVYSSMSEKAKTHTIKPQPYTPPVSKEPAAGSMLARAQAIKNGN
jgi:hypothetical protein